MSDPPADLLARIADGVEAIERTVTELRDLQGVSRSAYKQDENRLRRDAVERKFEKLTAAVIDVAETVLQIERDRVPDRRKAVVTELEAVSVIDADLGDELRAAVGFRDVLAHTYGPVVNDDIVYDALQNSLDRYVSFVECIDQYLSATNHTD
jgi:uncharacterized protein YutE (UPF0331/DUF86 family)